jgi:class 3 adenylate cyclase
MEDLHTRLQRDKGIQLALRIGIHTGLVVGTMGSSGRQNSSLGETQTLLQGYKHWLRPIRW